jgi:hypothetical protein
MKKNVFFGFLLSLFLLIGTSGVVNKVQAAPDQWYLVVTTVYYINGELVIQSECTEQVDDDCNMPGSVHRIPFPHIPW